MNRAYLSLGSNIEPERNLVQAVRLLGECCRLSAVSAVYETRPVGRADQPNFLNAAVLLETELAPEALKDTVLGPIEEELGRVRSADKNAPRTIDLDISLWNEEVLDLGPRHIPDPEIVQFPHIARPLANLAPGYVHPETGLTRAEIADRLPDAGLVLRREVVLTPAGEASQQ